MHTAVPSQSYLIMKIKKTAYRQNIPMQQSYMVVYEIVLSMDIVNDVEPWLQVLILDRCFL